MDGMIQKPGEDRNGGYITYRHAVQLTAGGQTHTLEVAIPIPLGADEEMRAQLLREAEAGMSQLAEQVRRRFSQSARQEQAAQSSVPTPTAATKPVSRPAAAPAPQTSTQPLQTTARSTERPAPVRKETVVPPARPSVGASMPATPPSSNNTGEMMTIPDFVKYIRERFNLLPNQAMALLGVKSLSGLNLREEALRLETLVAQQSTNGKENNAKLGQNEAQATRPAARSVPASAPAAPSDSASLPAKKSEDPPAEEASITVREERPVYIFDEEIGSDDEEELNDELEDLEDIEEEENELNPAVQSMAEDILKKLRDLRGATTVSPSRIQVLNNVVVSQIDDQRLHALIEGVWGVTAPKRLKVDQVEELISWAKTEDDFVNQVDAVLALIEEERFARGNR